MEVGQEVEVHTTFDNSWAAGFEIAEVIDRGRYRVRRKSDGTVLPTVTAEYDLRVAWLAVDRIGPMTTDLVNEGL